MSESREISEGTWRTPAEFAEILSQASVNRKSSGRKGWMTSTLKPYAASGLSTADADSQGRGRGMTQRTKEYPLDVQIRVVDSLVKYFGRSLRDHERTRWTETTIKKLKE